jgi:non-ribosomal peptide synthetase component F
MKSFRTICLLSRLPPFSPVAECAAMTPATGVREFARPERTATYEVLGVAYALLLGRYSCADDVLFGVPFANRTRASLTHLVGLVANTLPLRVRLAGSPTAGELVARVHDALVRALTARTDN